MRMTHQHGRSLYSSSTRNAGSSLTARMKDLRLTAIPPSTSSVMANRSFIFVTSDSDSEPELDHIPPSSSLPPSLPCIAPLSPISPISFASFESRIASPLVPASVTVSSDSEFDTDDEFESDYYDDDESASSCSSDTDDCEEEEQEEDFRVVFGFGVKKHDEDTDDCEDKENWKEDYFVRRQRLVPRSHRYRYRLASALPMAQFTTGPSSMNAPWPYTFQKGDTALALTSRGSNDPQISQWRRVTIVDNGHLSSFPPSLLPLPSPLLPFSSASTSFPTITPKNMPDMRYRAHSTSDLPSQLDPSLLRLGYTTMTTPQSSASSSSPLSPSTSPTLVYTAEWFDTFSGRSIQGTFCPTRGDLKPDDGHARRLLARERLNLID